MRVLLDECLPVDFRLHLPGHQVHTAQWAGLKGVKNGRMLRDAEAASYDVFITVDKGVPHQQKLNQRKIPVGLIRSKTSQIEDLLPYVPAILKELDAIQPGQIAIIT